MRYLIFLSIFLHGCFSFKGITIPPEVNTFYVDQVEISTANFPATIGQTFQETLRQKIRSQSRLTYSDLEPDISFAPTVTAFDVNSVAPQENDLVAFNRLEIRVSIAYESSKNEDDNYTKTYTAFEDFAADANLQDIQDGLIELIFEDITERIFNDTFSDW